MANFYLIACEIFTHEISRILDVMAKTEGSPRISAEFLPKGLHDLSAAERRNRLKEVIEIADHSGKYDAILLGYGLCSRGIVGLRTERVPLVVPRVHDCIALFFGGNSAYEKYFFEHPGTYFQTVGWQELGEDLALLPPESIQAQCGAGESLESFCEKYGPENGPWLWEELGKMTRNYSHLAFLKTVPSTDALCVEKARLKASENGWTLDVLQGTSEILIKLLNGLWDESDFLRVPPEYRIRESFDGSLIQAIRNENDR